MKPSYRQLTVLALAAAALCFTACGTDQSCASQSAAWQQQTNTCSGLAAGQAFDVEVTICQVDCQSSPACAVDVQAGTIQLDPVVHTCDESSCGIGSCAANPRVTCRVPGLTAGTYNLLVGSESGGTVVVGGSLSSCAI